MYATTCASGLLLLSGDVSCGEAAAGLEEAGGEHGSDLQPAVCRGGAVFPGHTPAGLHLLSGLAAFWGWARLGLGAARGRGGRPRGR